MHHHLHIVGLPLRTFFGWLVLLIPATVTGLGIGKAWRDSWALAALVALVLWGFCWLLLR